MKVCRARVVPLFPVYDGKTHRLTVLVRPPMDDLLDADDNTIARRMNEEVEVFVKPHTEQYTWILKLKTRKPGEIEPTSVKSCTPGRSRIRGENRSQWPHRVHWPYCLSSAK